MEVSKFVVSGLLAWLMVRVSGPACEPGVLLISSTIYSCTSKLGWDYLNGTRVSFRSQVLQSRCLENCYYNRDCTQAAHINYYGVYACMLLNGTTSNSTKPTFVTDSTNCTIMVINRNNWIEYRGLFWPLRNMLFGRSQLSISITRN